MDHTILTQHGAEIWSRFFLHIADILILIYKIFGSVQVLRQVSGLHQKPSIAGTEYEIDYNNAFMTFIVVVQISCYSFKASDNLIDTWTDLKQLGKASHRNASTLFSIKNSKISVSWQDELNVTNYVIK